LFHHSFICKKNGFFHFLACSLLNQNTDKKILLQRWSRVCGNPGSKYYLKLRRIKMLVGILKEIKVLEKEYV